MLASTVINKQFISSHSRLLLNILDNIFPAELLGDLKQCKNMFMFEEAAENDSNALFVYNEPCADDEDLSFGFLYKSGKS